MFACYGTGLDATQRLEQKKDKFSLEVAIQDDDAATIKAVSDDDNTVVRRGLRGDSE